MSDQIGTKLEITIEGGGKVRLELPMLMTRPQKNELKRLISGLIDLALEPPPPEAGDNSPSNSA